jgi:uncharacterized HAD superfamily protein
MEHKGLRFNEGKLRYDLIHPFAEEQLARVLTLGANKYAERNWERGMSWSSVIASLKRHLAQIEKGIDYDDETGELHAAHLLCNAHFLTAYYKIYPQGDDRPHNYLKQVKIGLDIDEVLCDWVKGWTEKFGYAQPINWHFSYENKKHFEELQTSLELEEFYLSLPRKVEPIELPFEPHCYITSRSIDVEITKRWLQNNGFPTAPVYSVGFGESKVQVAIDARIDIFVDDSFTNFVELNNAGICTFLMDAPHNQKYDVGFKRIKHLTDLI